MNLNEDIQLKPDEYNRWDMQFENGDLVNVSGVESLKNAIIIAIMTRYQELSESFLYDDFGCRIHELVKANKSGMVKYKIELFTRDVLEKMRRVKSINWIEVTDNHNENYHVEFSVNGLNDETITGEVNI